MEKSTKKEELVAERIREEIETIEYCQYCGTSHLMGGCSSPSADGKNWIIYCLNHKTGGVILSRFAFNPA